jgi:hypothetical protein
MKPGSGNSSLLGNCSVNRFPRKRIRMQQQKNMFLNNGSVNTMLGVLLETVFSIRSAQNNYKEEFS